ncbi:histone-lysine N-methyltransferase ATXR2 isoform X1 [Nicotiana tomentosiformis]|uniref:histone-lysine N-methyltransferase ATXR2 isoform X1 n=1 Tax=Nicotiana tomentosiformis TaxID=4098 RepID=UPI00051C4734|nr:histone-lysine N-methyltransferase ATXR2 isoform X1 [Nicotiana tomentosiformis]
MEIICSIDKQFSDQIAALLKPPPRHEVQKYFEELLATRQCRRLKVKPTAYHGKGVYAETDFKESDLVLKDQILAGAQHSSNKVDCLVCSYCFCFIGSIELQIGRKLYLEQLGVSPSSESHMQKDCYNSGSSVGEDDSDVEDQQVSGECASSPSKDKIPLPKDVVESLFNGEMQLPYSEKFPLPPIFSCPGGCKENYYCSKSCSEADWESFHSLLCTGEGSKSLSTKALLKFMEHANDTNDIFLLAAKVISFTILRHRKLKESRHEGKGKQVISESRDFSLLLEAWKPVSMGYKRRWWDCIALPGDVDGSGQASFRMQIKELAFTVIFLVCIIQSLQLLKAAIFDEECKPLLSLEMYGHIIGMFELNNLDLVVESPVEDYFLYIDDLPLPGKEEAEQTTKPILDALGDDYSICCQGTAFFPLQSCMNHSCRPNAKAFKREEDRDGQATIIALQPIAKGEEITISYIDEDLPFEERQALLADYGFRCRCSKCLEEA